MASVIPDQDVDSSITAVGVVNSKLQKMEEKWKRLKTLNTDLQEALEKSDIEVQELMQELASLREENKSLQREKAKFLDLMEESEKLKLSLEQLENATCTAQQGKKELERRYLQMEEKADQLLYQISISEEEKRLLHDDVTRLKLQVIELERYLDAKSLELREKDNQSKERELVIEEMTETMNQYLSIKEVLSNKIQELQSQLEESDQEIAMSEKQLEEAQMKKQGQGIQGFLGLRLLHNMVLEFLWCSFSVGVFLLFFFFFMRLYHALYTDHLLLDLRRVFSARTIEVIQNVLHPYLKMKGLGVMPS